MNGNNLPGEWSNETIKVWLKDRGVECYNLPRFFSTLQRENLIYTSAYCEENIYFLCQEIIQKQPDLISHCKVVFISSRDRSVPLWQQKIGQGEEKAVIWDYHVVLYIDKNEYCDSLVFDYDTTLPFPCPAELYIHYTLKPEYEVKLKSEYKRLFRFIEPHNYLKEFSSDRSHMLRDDGTYYATPPTYPAVVVDGKSNLDEYISMQNSSTQYGSVMSGDEFFASILRQGETKQC